MQVGIHGRLRQEPSRLRIVFFFFLKYLFFGGFWLEDDAYGLVVLGLERWSPAVNWSGEGFWGSSDPAFTVMVPDRWSVSMVRDPVCFASYSIILPMMSREVAWMDAIPSYASMSVYLPINIRDA